LTIVEQTTVGKLLPLFSKVAVHFQVLLMKILLSNYCPVGGNTIRLVSVAWHLTLQ